MYTRTEAGYETDKYVFFYGGPFSNWYACNYESGGERYNCSEQQFIAAKARLFNDSDALKVIMGTDDPSVQKRAGRLVQNYNNEEWEKVRYQVMLEAVKSKFFQNKKLGKILLSTKNKTIVEYGPDKIWGCGLYPQDLDILSQDKWPGTNLLGKVLMEVRNKLQTDIISGLEN